MNSLDMTRFIEAKSDQINADDLISGPRTITITRVSQGSAEQPVNVNFDGDDGKPFRPCKTVRRIMVAVWGPDAKDYVGRSMTLYRDPKVKFGGMEVGGIRVSHMSHIDEPKTLALMATKGKRIPYKVEPLRQQAKPNPAAAFADTFIANVGKCADLAKLDDYAGKQKERLDKLHDSNAGFYERCMNALDRKRAEFAPPANETVDDDWDDDAPASDEWADDSQPSDERPVWYDAVGELREAIADASGPETWKEAHATFQAIEAGLPDDIAAELRDALETRKNELRKAA